MKMCRKTSLEKTRLHYRRCCPLDSIVTPRNNAGPKQVLEPVDTKEKESWLR
jgi:hypothetical protein